MQLGVKVTEGLGAGARPQIGANAAEESIEQIVDHLAGAHMCFITAGMGGGTGTGAAPIIAQAARELGVLTVGVVTKPFMFEGPRRMRQAEDGVEALQKVVDTLIIIPNQNLFRLASMDTSITDAFQMADDVLYLGVKGVTDLMVKPGLINLDFADVRSVMDEMGKAMMGTGEATTEEFPEARAKTAAQAAIANPLLDEMSLKSAKGVLINVTGGYDMTLFELDEAANTIRESVDGDANIIVGSTLDEEMAGRMRVSVVATGIDAADVEIATPMPRRKLSEPIMPQRAELPAPAPEPAEVEADEGFRPAARQEVEQEPVAGEHDLPPPAYTPRVTAQPERREGYADTRLDAEPGSFVAPRAPARPAPAEALSTGDRASRIQQAASRAGRPLAAPERTPAPPAPATTAARRGINSLIGRMTGHPSEPDPRFAPTPRRPVAVQPQRAAEPARHEPDDEAEQDRIEIPAFLRRQAN